MSTTSEAPFTATDYSTTRTMVYSSQHPSSSGCNSALNSMPQQPTTVFTDPYYTYMSATFSLTGVLVVVLVAFVITLFSYVSVLDSTGLIY
mgnify:CR=1 FL=1